MADNVAITAGVGTTIAADDIGGVLHQRVKISQGADGAAADVSSANPLPVSLLSSVSISALNAGGSLSAFQGGAWNVGNIGGSLSAFQGGSWLVSVATLPVMANVVNSTIAVTQSGTWDEVGINDSGNSITIDGNVGVIGGSLSAWNAGGSLSAFQGGAWNIGINAGTNNIGDVDILSIAAGSNNIGDVDAIQSGTWTVQPGNTPNTVAWLVTMATLPVVGTFDVAGQATVTALQGDAGSSAWRVTMATLPVIANITNSTLAVTQSGTWDEVGINDSGNSITVDGTVTADLGAVDNAVLDAIAASTAAIETAVEGTLTVTGGGGGVEYTEGDTDATIVGSAIMWEDTSDTLRAVSAAKPLPVSDAGGALTVDGTVAVTNAGITTIAGAVSGTEMQVDVLTMPTVTVTATNLDVQSGGADLATTTQAGAIQTAVETIDNAVHVDDAAYTLGTHSGVMMMGFAGTQSVNANDAGAVAMETDGSIHIHDGGNTITVDGTVTANLSATDNTVLDNIDADTSAIQTAVEIIDNAISGNEMQVDVVAALPAGTNAIGKLAANSGVDIGDVTLTAGTAAIGTLLPSDIDVTTHTNYAKKYYTNAGAVTDGIVWSPAAGKRFHILSLFVNVSAAATVTFEDDLAGGDSPILKMELAANSGTVIPFPDKYPLASAEDAADLIVTTSAGNVYITVVGYEI